MEILASTVAIVNTFGYGRGMDDRLNRQHWLDAGLERLASHGPQGLRIMAIAEQLGVTKGSFYWHFRDQREYAAALLAEWELTRTQHIIDQVERAVDGAAMKLRNLMSVTVAADPRLALAIRSWASTDPLVRKAVKRVDKKRLAYLSGLIAALGWSDDDAATLARWAHGALLGYFILEGPALTEAQIDLILSTLTSPNKPPSAQRYRT